MTTEAAVGVALGGGVDGGLEVRASGRGSRISAKRRCSAAEAPCEPRLESRVATIRQSFGAATSREPSGSESGRPARNDERSPNALSGFARSISSITSHFFLPAAARTWPMLKPPSPTRPTVSLAVHFGLAVASAAPSERPACTAALAMASASVVLPEPAGPAITTCLPVASAATTAA